MAVCVPLPPLSSHLTLWHLAWRGLNARPVRSWLTALSVAVAAASLTAFLALGAGLKQAVETQISSIGPQLQLSGADLLQSFSPPPTLPQGLVEQVRALGAQLGLESVTPVLLGYQGEGTAQVTLYGVPAGLQAIFPGLRMASGRMLSAADQGQRRVVLGAAVARKGGLLVGQTVQVRRQPMRVVGVMAPTSSLTDGFLVVPLDTLQTALRVPGMVSLVAVQVADERAVPQVAAKLARTFGLEAQTQADFRTVTRRLLTVSGLVQTALGLVALLVGALCVLNTVSMSVLERQAEFAALRAIGVRPGWLLRLVVAESLLLSLLGGLIGLVLGSGAALGISAVTRRAVGVRAALMTPGVALEVLMACLLIGVLAGLPAAWRCGRRSIMAGLAAQ